LPCFKIIFSPAIYGGVNKISLFPYDKSISPFPQAKPDFPQTDSRRKKLQK
jgi:hypothetical protein